MVCGEDRLTYAEFLSLVAGFRAELDEGRGARVGVFGYRTVALPAWLVAIQLSGCSFVVLDPSASESFVEWVREAAGLSRVVDPRTWQRPSGAVATTDRPSVGTLDDEAYVLYTSGSTGRPKGVSVTHRNLASSNAARLAVYREFGAPTFLALSAFFFDSSMAGLWATLTSGGTLVIAREDERRDPWDVARLISRHRITHVLSIPGFYAEVLRAIRAQREVDLETSLKVAICAGETLPSSVVDLHFETFGRVPLINEYGPTECTVWSTWKRMDAPGMATIGTPIPGTTVHLLDSRLIAVPAGHIGHIGISGPGVANGYLADPEETRRRFVQREGPRGTRVRVYLTGDLGRIRPDGELEYLGRLDRQVKVRGVRVNLESVERVLSDHQGLREAALVYDERNQRCHAFAVREELSDVAEAEVRAVVADALGAGHVPDGVTFLADLPRTNRGKVDSAALLDLVLPGVARQRDTVTPNPPKAEQDMQVLVEQAWESVLGVSLGEQTRQTSFFDLGGNSMSVLRLARALSEVAGRPVSAATVYRNDTVERQAKLLDGLAASPL